MKLRLLYILISLLFIVNISAQQLLVTDDQTNAPLALVSVICIDSQTSVITNNQGIADLATLDNACNFEIRLIGYESLSITIEELKALNFKVKLHPKDYLLNQVVVSAQRWSTESAQLPSKIIGIKQAQVEMQNPQTAADLLNISGEVFIQKSQMGGGSPMIRGFSANRLLISVDGVRMNTAIFRGGNLQNIISLDPFAISNTEVFFGPGSVIYGSDAIGGVMSFFTLEPKLSDSCNLQVSGNANMRYSSANREKTGHFDINLGWEKWAMTTSASHFNYNDLKMGKYGPDDYLRPFYVERVDGVDSIFNNPDQRVQNPTAYSQTNFMQKIRYRPNNAWDFNYAFHYSTSSDNPRYDRLVRTRDGLPRSAEWYYGPQKWMMNMISIDHIHSTKFYDKWSMKGAYQHFEESRISRDFGDDWQSRNIEKVDALSINADFLKEFRENDQLFYGIEWVYNDVTSTGFINNIINDSTINGPSRYPKSNWSSYAAYINYNYHVNNKLLIIGGMRYNRYVLNANFDTTFYPFPFTTAQINNGALVGNLGFNYQPGNNWVFTLNLSTGFRAPNIDDMGKVFDSEPGAVVVPNPDLEAEYIYNGEIGISKGIGEFVSVDARVFYSILEQAMVRRDYSLNGMDSMMYEGEMSKIQAIQNAAQARVWGFSLGLEARLMKGLQLSSRFNYQKGEEEMDDGNISPSRHAAPMFGLTSLNYEHKKWKMNLYVQYSGEISYESLALEERSKTYLYATDSDGNPYSPAWYTINYKLLYQLHDMIQLSAGLENITNQRYRSYSSGISAAGTNFIFSLNFRF